jgi:hypothetical protein
MEGEWAWSVWRGSGWVGEGVKREWVREGLMREWVWEKGSPHPPPLKL